MKKLLISLAALLAFQAQALSINTMQLVGDKAGNGVFTLTNDLDYTSFVNVNIIKYDVQGDKIIKTPYTKENLKDWEVTVTHPKMILEPGTTKQVGIRSLCGKSCDFSRDHVYQVNFSPEPYAETDAEKPSVAINVGYAPLFIIPAEKQDIKYSVKNLGDKIYVENTGNSFVRLGVTMCSQTKTKNCRTAFTVLAGRKKYFDLPANIRGDQLNIIVLNHDNSFVRREVINRSN